MMTRVAAAVLASLMGVSMAAAQTPPAAPTAATAPTQAATGAPTAKQARSKQCSAEADQKGLHGKARKTFRSKCKAGKA